MELGFIGVGRMGYNLVLNLIDHGYRVLVYDTSSHPVQELEKHGAIPIHRLEDIIPSLPSPRVTWLMLPAPQVDPVLQKIVPNFHHGDIIIDGGNSYYQDSIRRYHELKERGIHFLDCGTSGGMAGARHGACMMVGGDPEIFKAIEMLFRDLSTKDGYAYIGKAGAGHFVKMVHNSIEYGMMGALAEGMHAIKDAPLGLDPAVAIKTYAHGSIIQSRLVDWLQEIYAEGTIDQVAGTVPYGETEKEMERLEQLAKMPVLHADRLQRVTTRANPCYAGQLLAALRNKFGGHQALKK